MKVPIEMVDERWFGRPFYVGPDGDDESYFALLLIRLRSA